LNETVVFTVKLVRT